MKRRTFIKQSSLYGAMGLGMACTSKTKNTVTAPTEKSIGVALLGLGGYSRGQLGPALKLTKHCYLAGIVTGSPDKIPTWQREYDVPDANVYSYDSLPDIANNDAIDVVYIVVPTGLHAKYAIAAAEAGKHVWCEKPMAMNTKECQSIIDACAKNKVRLSIGYRMLHEPNTQTLISYVDSKPFGAITGVEASACYKGGGPNGWRASKALGGGAMYDMGVYTVNGIRYATGLDAVEVMSAQHIIDRPKLFKEVDETTIYSLRLSNGLIANGVTSVGRSGNKLQVNCEDGWYNLSPMQSYNGVVGDRSDGKTDLQVFVESQQALQMDDDALAILNNTDVMCPGIEGLKDIHIIEGIFESAATGKAVAL